MKEVAEITHSGMVKIREYKQVSQNTVLTKSGIMNLELPPVIKPSDDNENSPGLSGKCSGGHDICHLSVDSEEKLHICKICEKTFSLKLHLKEHLLTHRGEKPLVCNICNKSFTRQRTLNVHLLAHSGDKPHVCNICNKQFTLKGQLKDHLLTHSGEKLHVCNICKKSFSRQRTLKKHLLTHSGEKPYVCDNCNKSFPEKENLKRHLLTHSEEKPHVCNICNKSFTQKGYLKKHLLTPKGERCHECKMCRKSFSSKSCLNYHKRHCRKTDKISSFDRGEGLSFTAGKSKNDNYDSHLAETSENSHENNYPGKLQVKKEIDYIVKEEHDISDEEYSYPNVDEILIKRDVDVQEMYCDVDVQEMYCDVKEENIQNALNDFVKEENDIDNEDMVY